MYISNNDLVSCFRIKNNQIVDITGKQWDTSKVTVGKGLINPQAILFSNYNDYMFTKNPYSDLDFEMNDFTIAAWFRLDKVSPFVGLLCRKNYYSARVGLTFDSSYFPYISTGNANVNIYKKTDTGYSGGGTPVHIAITRKSDIIYIFINGKITLSWDNSQPCNFNQGGTTVIGSDAYQPNCQLYGVLDDFTVASKCLFDDEFTPPTKNLVSATKKIYLLESGAAYGMI